MRLLHAGHDHGVGGAAAAAPAAQRGRDRARARRQPVPLHRLREHRRRGEAGGHEPMASERTEARAPQPGANEPVIRAAPLRQRPAGARASRTRRCSPAAAASPTTSSLPGQTAHRASLRSPYAHARIARHRRRGRAGDARRAGGVHRRRAGGGRRQAAWPAAGASGAPTAARRRQPPRRALAHELVRFVGEAVVAVVAETREAARAAPKRCVVDYEELPAVTDAGRATAAGAPASARRGARQHRRRDAPRRRRGRRSGVRRAPRTWSSLDIVNQRLAPSADGAARGARATSTPTSGRAHGAHEQPDADRRARRAVQRRCPGSADREVRVVVGDVGGGFGMKTGVYPEDIVVAYAARALKRPGEVAGRAQRGVPRRRPRPRRRQPRRAGARRQRQGAGACACSRSPTSAPTPRRPASSIQLLIGPWVVDQHLRHRRPSTCSSRRC